MSPAVAADAIPRWEDLRTDDTRELEAALRAAPALAGARIDAYRTGPAAIRLRVVDPHFEGLDPDRREALVMPLLLDSRVVRPEIREDILWIFLIAPSEFLAADRGPALAHLPAHADNRLFIDPS